jgi:glycosyltransferase involved in cell wall biosynthesis
MKIIYRISDTGYNKVKPLYINNENCLKNAVKTFGNSEFLIIADNVSDKTKEMIEEYVPTENINHVSVGHGAGTFNLALDLALKQSDGDVIYFLENDYLHTNNAETIIMEGINLGADYVSGYDHPDKYIPASRGGNPQIEDDGGETTKVYLTKSSHWKITNSTTMTFAAKVSTLKRDEAILRKYTNMGHYPQDYKMFLELRENNAILVTSIPGISTHGESMWLSPGIDWESV